MLTVAVSSRALFNLEDGQAIFETHGVSRFDAYMRENEGKPLRPGAAFQLVKKLLALNSTGARDKVEVILLSSNTLEAGARVMNSVRHYGLDISRAMFTSGGDRFRIAKAYRVHLFLTTNQQEVRKALAAGIAAARVMPTSRIGDADDDQAPLTIAFDGDSVLFSDEAERVYQAAGLEEFVGSEQRHAMVPLQPGPLKPVLDALLRLKEALVVEGKSHRLTFALVTARSVQVYERVLHTFRAWGVQLEHAYFLDGAEKGPLLEALGADLFFDDGMHNIESALRFVPACHVPHGVVGSRDCVSLEVA